MSPLPCIPWAGMVKAGELVPSRMGQDLLQMEDRFLKIRTAVCGMQEQYFTAHRAEGSEAGLHAADHVEVIAKAWHQAP